MSVFKRRQFLKISFISGVTLFFKSKTAFAQFAPFAFWKNPDSFGTLQATQALLLAIASGTTTLRITQVMLVVAAK